MKFGLTLESFNKIKEVIKKYNMYEFKVFGSRARGDYKKGSDIDLAVYGDIEDKTKFNIRNDFDMLDIPYMIDLIFVQDISKEELIKSIKKDGVDFIEQI